MKQEDAINFIKLGKNIFLTGEAGAGKTYLLNQYIQYLKNNHVAVAVTASTGIAATHLQGSTIHSWSGMGVKDNLTEQDLKKLLDSKRIKKNVKNTKVLIIDEISMLHYHQLDMVNEIAQYIKNSDQPFGGMQVILCGDFFQLPPISSSTNEKKFAFHANAWREADFQVCYLSEQHRQTNDSLLAILKDIRNGTAGEHTKIPLRTRYKKDPEGTTKATKLYSRNVNVDAINEKELAQLPGDEKSFTMNTTGFSALVESLKKSCLAPDKLKLKIGAEVMFVKNDPTGRFANGTRAVVVSFEKFEGWPVVKTHHNQIIVVHPAEWKYEEEGIIRASMCQVPLRLAWAITIHKSQGMTLDTAEMDLGDTFEPGMGYVALSRVRNLNGLKLMNLNEMALKVHPDILQNDVIFKNQSENAEIFLKSFSTEALLADQNKILMERFKGNTLLKIKAVKSKKITNGTHLVTLDLFKKSLSIDAIANERGLTFNTIIAHLIKLIGLKKIKSSDMLSLIKNISEEDFSLILSEWKKTDDGKEKPIYDKFCGKYSYEQIKIVKLFYLECEVNRCSEIA